VEREEKPATLTACEHKAQISEPTGTPSRPLAENKAASGRVCDVPDLTAGLC